MVLGTDRFGEFFEAHDAPYPMSTFLSSFYIHVLRPGSSHEDTARREFILNILIGGALILLFVGICIDGVNYFTADPDVYSNNSLPRVVLYMLTVFFAGLYLLSRWYSVSLASYLLVGTLFGLAAYMGYEWGVDVPAQIVFYPLIIVMAGILLSTRVAFVATLLIIATMLGTAYLHARGVAAPNQYWKDDLWTWTDIVMMAVMYLIVASASWLSNREMEKSLVRARRSETTLAKERDTLEERVQERTAAVHALQVERMADTYRLVEFGRIASGMFHDLISPLTALSLNIERIRDASQAELAEDVARATRAAAHMQKRLEVMRKHVARTGTKEACMVGTLITDTVDVLSTYARARSVTLSYEVTEALPWYGDPVALSQVMTNLISNAVQSYAQDDVGVLRTVFIRAVKEGADIVITVHDTGSGIPPELLAHIFEPFVSIAS